MFEVLHSKSHQSNKEILPNLLFYSRLVVYSRAVRRFPCRKNEYDMINVDQIQLINIFRINFQKDVDDIFKGKRRDIGFLKAVIWRYR